jgi:hypothetical protein
VAVALCRKRIEGGGWTQLHANDDERGRLSSFVG